MNNINYYNVNKICFDKLFETIDAKRVIYDVVALLEHLQIEGAFLDKVVPLFTLINSYIVFRNICFIQPLLLNITHTLLVPYQTHKYHFI